MDGRLDRLSYPQRQTLRALQWIGGIGKRLSIADAAGMDGTQVASALTVLRKEGMVMQIEGTKWALTEDGAALLAGEIAQADSPAAPAPVPVAGSTTSPRTDLATELARLGKPKPTEFDPAEAAWLCAALHKQFADMPAISALLGRMSEYWERVCR